MSIKTHNVSELNLDEYHQGTKSHLLIEVIDNNLGFPLRIPIIVIKGKAGPVVGITAAVHGNEINGIPVIHKLIEKIDPKKINGTIVAIPVFNIPGFDRGQREFQEGTDLNHIMPGKRWGNTPQAYTYALINKIIKKFDNLIDLHTASEGRINTLYVRADMTQHITAKMAYLQKPQIIVHNPASDHTLRGAAMELNIPAITVEIGNPQRFQSKYINKSVRGLKDVLAYLKITKNTTSKNESAPIICKKSYWLFSDRGGLLTVFPQITDYIKKGEKIAEVKDIFGNVLTEYLMPEDGIVIGKSVNPVGQTGSRILHLGVLAEDTDNYIHFAQHDSDPDSLEPL